MANGQVDTSSLPPEIQAYIAQEVAKALAANQPSPPKELTPEEKARLYLAQAVAGLNGEKVISAGSMYVHHKLSEALAVLVDQAFPVQGVETLVDTAATAEGAN